MKLKRLLIKLLGLHGKAHNRHERELDLAYGIIEQ